jgi:hypothetical protein
MVGCTIVIQIVVFVDYSHHHHIHQLTLCTIFLGLDCQFLMTKLILMLSALNINSVLTIPLLVLNPVLIHHVSHQIPRHETFIVVTFLAVSQQGHPWSFQWLSKCTVFLGSAPSPTFRFSPPPWAWLDGKVAAANSSN